MTATMEPTTALPRLVPGQRPAVKTEEVELPGIGASVLIKGVSTGLFLEIQEQDLDEVGQAMALSACALVEPEMTAEELRDALDDWPVSDWLILQTAVMKLSGIGADALEAAQKQFRATGD